MDLGPGSGDIKSNGLRKPATRFAQSAVSVPTNAPCSSSLVSLHCDCGFAETAGVWLIHQELIFAWCLAQEMVVVAGVHPEADLNDLAIWRPHLI